MLCLIFVFGYLPCRISFEVFCFSLYPLQDHWEGRVVLAVKTSGSKVWVVLGWNQTKWFREARAALFSLSLGNDILGYL